MPRKHPEQDPKSSGPSPAVLAERRAARAARRSKKSPPGSKRDTLLTPVERELLEDQLRLLGLSSDKMPSEQFNRLSRNLNYDLQLDRDTRPARRSRRNS
jgi:hypothetical protein